MITLLGQSCRVDTTGCGTGLNRRIDHPGRSLPVRYDSRLPPVESTQQMTHGATSGRSALSIQTTMRGTRPLNCWVLACKSYQVPNFYCDKWRNRQHKHTNRKKAAWTR